MATHNIWVQDLDRCTSSPEGFQTMALNIISKVQENNQVYWQVFFKHIPSVIISKDAPNIQRFYALYLLFKISEKKDMQFANLLAKKEELLTFLYYTAQYDSNKKISFDERGKTFFSKKPSRTEAFMGMNFLRLCHESLLNWKNMFGSQDPKHPCHPFNIFGDFTSKQMKNCTYFWFIGRNYDFAQNLATWEFLYRLPKTSTNVGNTTLNKSEDESSFQQESAWSPPTQLRSFEEHHIFLNRPLLTTHQSMPENLQKAPNSFLATIYSNNTSSSQPREIFQETKLENYRQEIQKDIAQMPDLIKSTSADSNLPTILNRRAQFDSKVQEVNEFKKDLKDVPNLKLDFSSGVQKGMLSNRSATFTNLSTPLKDNLTRPLTSQKIFSPYSFQSKRPAENLALDLAAIENAIQKSRDNGSNPVSPSDLHLIKQNSYGFSIPPKVHSYNMLDKKTAITPRTETEQIQSSRSMDRKTNKNIIVFEDEEQQEPRREHKKFTFGPIQQQDNKPTLKSNSSVWTEKGELTPPSLTPRKDSSTSLGYVAEPVFGKHASEPPKSERAPIQWKSENFIKPDNQKPKLNDREERMSKMFEDYATKLKKTSTGNLMQNQSIASFGTLPTEQDEPGQRFFQASKSIALNFGQY